MMNNIIIEINTYSNISLPPCCSIERNKTQNKQVESNVALPVVENTLSVEFILLLLNYHIPFLAKSLSLDY